LPAKTAVPPILGTVGGAEHGPGQPNRVALVPLTDPQPIVLSWISVATLLAPVRSPPPEMGAASLMLFDLDKAVAWR
jgi:hypothetical protein